MTHAELREQVERDIASGANYAIQFRPSGMETVRIYRNGVELDLPREDMMCVYDTLAKRCEAMQPKPPLINCVIENRFCRDQDADVYELYSPLSLLLQSLPPAEQEKLAGTDRGKRYRFVLEELE